MCLCERGLCQSLQSSNRNFLEVVIPGLIGNSYDETIRTDAVPTGPERHFEIDGRYSRQVHKSLSLGISVHSRKYDKGQYGSGNLSQSTTVDFSTSVLGMGGFFQACYDKKRILPYVALGAGYRRIKLRDDFTSFTRVRPDEIFHSSRESTMHKFGIELFGGLRFVISNQIFAAVEADYFTAHSILHSVGANVGLGMSW